MSIVHSQALFCNAVKKRIPLNEGLSVVLYACKVQQLKYS